CADGPRRAIQCGRTRGRRERGWQETGMTADDIGRRLREVRLERGLSLRSLAQTLGVSASLISQVETGKTQPSVSTLFAMVTQLGMSLDEFLSPDGADGAAGTVRSAPAQPGESSVVQRAA